MKSAASSLRIAYADPPYPGFSHLYKDHPDYAGEVDHVELIRGLQEFDGWALSTAGSALQSLLPLCPTDVRILIWVKHTIGVSWEPIIVRPARQDSRRRVRDWLHCEPEGFSWRPRPDGYVIGQKPEPFCMWLFEWLGAEPEDDFHDLFPGSGNVGSAWRKWRMQPHLPITSESGISRRRARKKALAAHPTIGPLGAAIGTETELASREEPEAACQAANPDSDGRAEVAS